MGEYGVGYVIRSNDMTNQPQSAVWHIRGVLERLEGGRAAEQQGQVNKPGLLEGTCVV